MDEQSLVMFRYMSSLPQNIKVDITTPSLHELHNRKSQMIRRNEE